MSAPIDADEDQAAYWIPESNAHRSRLIGRSLLVIACVLSLVGLALIFSGL